MDRKNKKTTLYLNDDDYRSIKGIAQADGKKPAELIRDILGEYVRRRSKDLYAGSVGSGRSGRSDLSERADDFLEGFGS